VRLSFVLWLALVPMRATGSPQGAPRLLVGAVLPSGDQVRITARVVDMATGTIQAADLADGAVGTLDDTLRCALGGLPADLGPP
jgi:TolB-like protein